MKRLALCFAVLVAAPAFAQNTPDFSGVFLLDTVLDEHKHYETAPPTILEVKQAAGEITVTFTLNGETAMLHCILGGKDPNELQGELKGRSLVLRKTSASKQLGVELPSAVRPPTHVEEKWELSPDLKQLTIRRKVERGADYGFIVLETYKRQASLEAAQAAANSAANECNMLNELVAKANEKAKKEEKYASGVSLGGTVLHYLTRCVSFTAVLSGEFFKGLEKSRKQGEFRKGEQIVPAFSDDIVLEVRPSTKFCAVDAALVSPPPLIPTQDNVSELRFLLRWLGPEVRDLGELQSAFLYDPWKESEPSEAFYRMRIFQRRAFRSRMILKC